ncbi:MAG: DNA translocase FtsK, partial [Longimicrobiales bacterium]
LLGVGAPVLALLPLLAGAAAFGWVARGHGLRWALLLLGLAVLLPTAAMLATPESTGGTGLLDVESAGLVGGVIGALLVGSLGLLGAVLLLVFVFLALCVATLGWNPLRGVVRGTGAALSRVRARDAGAEPTLATPGSAPVEPESGDPAAGSADVLGKVTGRGRRARRERAPDLLEDTGRPESDDLPPIELLTEPPPRDAQLAAEEFDRVGRVLIDTLRTFRVEGQIGGRTTGPVVTQYEVVPAPGVKVNRIANLDADLALALKAPSVRIVAPIPGKGAVGVEVPNPVSEVVQLREILEAPQFRRARAHLPLALGKDLTGHPYVADLTRMPHLLIAGATGSGKSVCINTIITSLIYRHSPRSLRLLMIDPKMVELSMYGDIPHLRHPVVTDPKDAAVVLRWAVLEMERRYALLSANGARSLGEFNRRVEEGRPLRHPEDDSPAADGEEPAPYEEGPLPYIVVIVDELADLMMAVQSEIERPLAQLAQKARAIGIHLIVATQRPSVNVITGLIKANFSCRIAFRVSSKVDSRTIIDQNGADALLGNGDMLFLPPGHADPVRVQGAFIDTEETERLMAWYRERAERPLASEQDILEVVRAKEAEEAESVADDVLEERDELFQQAAEICVHARQGSTSLLQRRLRIGYGRAARIIDQLHHAGVLGPPDGSKPREVLVGPDALDGLA